MMHLAVFRAAGRRVVVRVRAESKTEALRIVRRYAKRAFGSRFETGTGVWFLSRLTGRGIVAW